MQIKELKISDVNYRKLAEFTYSAMKNNNLLPEGITKDILLHTITRRLNEESYDLVFLAVNERKIEGWLAIYQLTDSEIAQTWNWHPIINLRENEDLIANELLQKTFSHLKALGKRKIAIDFPRVNKNTEPYYHKLLNWYSKFNLKDTIEEKYYKKNIRSEEFEAIIPNEYSLGSILDLDQDELFNCWEEIFSSSQDQIFHSLDFKGRKEFFLESWGKEKPIMDEASFTIFHNDKLIGFIRIIPSDDPKDGLLSPIGILPEYRRKGLAQELMKMSMLKLKELNYETISFYVSASNTTANIFYEKLGFEFIYKIASLFGDII